jgi:tetratricopeptide (TPR) repeat protein
MRARRVGALFIFLAVGLFHAAADGLEDFSVQIFPAVELPIGAKSAVFNPDGLFRFGAGGNLRGQYIFPRLPMLYAEAALAYSLHPTAADPLSLLSVGAGTGINLRIGDAMSLQAGAEVGWYGAFFSGLEPASNPFAGGAVGLAFDFSPTFSLAAGAGYRYCLGYDSGSGSFTDFYQGVNMRLGTVFRLSSGKYRSKLKIQDTQFNPVFPVFYGYYDSHPVGSITIVNGENSPISDLEVSFFVNQYMEQPKVSATVPRVGRNQAATVDLYALFTNSVLQLTERTKVSSEIIAEYTYLGKRFTQKIPYTLSIYDRNSMTWDDDRKAASFVTAKDPTVLIFSKNSAGIIREHGYNPINLNLRIALGIFETLRLYGMNYVIDPQSAYTEASQSGTFIDYLQFPSQTLIYRAGDCDDLSILFSSMLESVGIETAFITIPGHIYMAFSLGISQEEAGQQFADLGDYIFREGQTWVPVEITMVSDGFLKAWKEGAKEWREAEARKEADFFPVHDAWRLYEPVGMSSAALSLVYPSKENILEYYNAGLEAFVEGELSGEVTELQLRISQEGDSPRLRNKFGIFYARYGKFAEAEVQFRKALELKRDYAPPMVNLGNIYFLRRLAEDALTWYERAAKVDPDNRTALAGLARAQYELQQYDALRESYAKLKAVDPGAATRYSYLAEGNRTVGRASLATDRGYTSWDEE